MIIEWVSHRKVSSGKNSSGLEGLMAIHSLVQYLNRVVFFLVYDLPWRFWESFSFNGSVWSYLGFVNGKITRFKWRLDHRLLENIIFVHFTYFSCRKLPSIHKTHTHQWYTVPLVYRLLQILFWKCLTSELHF